MSTFLFSFSAADNHWLDLHKIITGSDYDPFTDNELKNAKILRKLVRENPHIVDAYFYERFQTLLDFFFRQAILKLRTSGSGLNTNYVVPRMFMVVSGLNRILV